MTETAVRLIPALIPEVCNGCMDCVANCRSEALFGRVVDRQIVIQMLSRLERTEVRKAIKSRFVPRSSFQAARQVDVPADVLFTVFLDTDKCLGCGDCVKACEQLHALELVPADDLWIEDLHFDLFQHLPSRRAA